MARRAPAHQHQRPRAEAVSRRAVSARGARPGESLTAALRTGENNDGSTPSVSAPARPPQSPAPRTRRRSRTQGLSPWWRYHQGIALSVLAAKNDDQCALFSVRIGLRQGFVTARGLTADWLRVYVRYLERTDSPERARALEAEARGEIFATPERTQ